ncbi:Lrp/AsnC family transcriptional regulator [Billgrantia gudaonensis]|uniref:Transcriptional regulator, AsnC family n=1 Tax=Billgrantia gudaonensis TaxID=376427 RepID=A0A1G9DPA6_9GAMM|nr:Lrp/AsnC family transcriptional regulator [Halomonas gudaonensis]SDK65727.1 transcriptional regulator, AsnC family [Halomonas gudaonensis]
MDRLDLRILDQLQNDASLTNQDLAARVGLSPSACLKRVRRLKECGVIQREVALVAPDALGASLHMVVEVTMVRDDKPLYRDFIRRVEAAPEVSQCYQVTGEVDFVLIVNVADMQSYDRLCDSVLYAGDAVHKFRTLISRKRNKFETRLPLGV